MKKLILLVFLTVIAAAQTVNWKQVAATSGYIPRRIDSPTNGLVNSVIYESSSAIGVGTTSPSTGLHVRGVGTAGIITSERTGLNGLGPALVTGFATDARTAGDGLILTFSGLDSGSAAQQYARINSIITDPTAASEDAYASISVVVAGTMVERFRVDGAGPIRMTPTATQTLAAGSPIVANGYTLNVAGLGGAVTLTAAPTIADGTDGDYIVITGTSDTNTLTVQDEGTLPSSNLYLGAASRVLGNGDVLMLKWSASKGAWVQMSFSNN